MLITVTLFHIAYYSEQLEVWEVYQRSACLFFCTTDEYAWRRRTCHNGRDVPQSAEGEDFLLLSFYFVPMPRSYALMKGFLVIARLTGWAAGKEAFSIYDQTVKWPFVRRSKATFRLSPFTCLLSNLGKFSICRVAEWLVTRPRHSVFSALVCLC